MTPGAIGRSVVGANLQSDATSHDVGERLRRDGYVVIEGLLGTADTAAQRARVQALLDAERAAASPQLDGDLTVTPGEDQEEAFADIWRMSPNERALLLSRIRSQRAAEFDTPWPVPYREVCVSFIPIPTFFDEGRSQRVFNLVNKDAEVAPLLEHPLVLAMVDEQLGPDAVLLDVSINHVGPGTDGGGWHVDSPISHMPEPFPDYTLSIQTVWMLDEFRADNGATHVARGSHLSLRAAPGGRAPVPDEVVLEAPAGSLAIWLSQTWHRHGANRSDGHRCGLIVQYGRSWVKPFVDLRAPLTADTAVHFSPRLRYMMGCNAHAPVRG